MFLHATEESARNRDIVVSNHAASLPSDKMLEGFQASSMYMVIPLIPARVRLIKLGLDFVCLLQL